MTSFSSIEFLDKLSTVWPTLETELEQQVLLKTIGSGHVEIQEVQASVQKRPF